MVAEVTQLLAERDPVVDMTVGAGGHAAALLEAGVRTVVGVDRDPEALRLAGVRLAAYGERVRLVRARFSEVDEDVVGAEVGGVLFDLGVSSMQLDRSERGFSFRADGPLDMRMDPEGPSAADLVNRLSERELADLIFRLGEEPRSRRIAGAVLGAGRPGACRVVPCIVSIAMVCAPSGHAAYLMRSAARSRAEAARGLAVTSSLPARSAPLVSSRNCGAAALAGTGRPGGVWSVDSRVSSRLTMRSSSEW